MTPPVESVVCFKWTPRPGYRSTFPSSTVNSLAAMVRRHYPRPVRIVCVTDDPAGIDAAVDVLPIWNDFADLPSPHGGNNPSCYRRLRLFHPDIGSILGARFVSVDLDCVITGDLSPVWDRTEPLVCWGDTNPLPGSHYNGSMILMTAGARPHVWTDFDPRTSPRKALQAGCFGSDQGWMSYRLGPGETRWSTADGVYSFRNHIKPRPGRALPTDARIVFFHGKQDPWTSPANGLDWVQRHYPTTVAV